MSFLAALKCQNHDRPPIWLMRQAGRYLPEYLRLKEGKRLFDLFHDPDMIVKITKLPIEILNVDAAILFSDILTVLDGMGIGYDFQDGVGPVVSNDPFFKTLEDPNLAYSSVLSAVVELKKELSVPLIGFAGAPFTIACYLIEKKTSRDQKKTKQRLFTDPLGFEKLIDYITEATIAYLKAQERSGVDAIQIFDSWAHALSIYEFRKFCLKPMQKILSALSVPAILFCKGSSFFASELAALHPNGISIDWTAELSQIRKVVPSSIALQGNLDPMALYASKDEIKKAAERILTGMKNDPGFIFNLGHGLLPDIPADNVKFLVDYVQCRS